MFKISCAYKYFGGAVTYLGDLVAEWPYISGDYLMLNSCHIDVMVPCLVVHCLMFMCYYSHL